MSFKIGARITTSGDISEDAKNLNGPPGATGPDGSGMPIIPFNVTYTPNPGSWVPEKVTFDYTTLNSDLGVSFQQTIVTIQVEGIADNTNIVLSGHLDMPFIYPFTTYGSGYILNCQSIDSPTTYNYGTASVVNSFNHNLELDLTGQVSNVTIGWPIYANFSAELVVQYSNG